MDDIVMPIVFAFFALIGYLGYLFLAPSSKIKPVIDLASVGTEIRAILKDFYGKRVLTGEGETSSCCVFSCLDSSRQQERK